MERNKEPFWCALYDSKTLIPGSAGEYAVKRKKPVKVFGNISPGSGSASVDMFGTSIQYDRTIIMDSSFPGLDENSVLWIDREPELLPDGSPRLNNKGEPVTPHDYVVVRIAKGLNSVALAVRKVR